MEHITGTFTKYSSLNFLRNQQRFALEDHIMNFHLDGGYKCYANDIKLCESAFPKACFQIITIT